MQDIEAKALSTYEKNLEYFLKTNHTIFKKIQLFDIASDHINLKYELEYKDGYFDVIEILSKHYLYNTNSNEYAKEVAAGVNYNKNTFLFNGVMDYHVSPKQIEIVKAQKEFTHSNIKDVLPIMHYAMKTAPSTTTMKHIDKFIFIGVGLGGHVTAIDEKIKSSEYLIIEDDTELFRLSMFVTPYYELAKKANLHFSIAQNENDFTRTMAGFLEGSFFNNRYIKYFHFPAHSNAKIKLIQNNLASQTYFTFPYDIQLDKHLRPLKRIVEGYKTLNVSKKLSEAVFSQNPVLVLAAGPSFKKNISWVKENKDKFIILAVSSVLKTLHEHGITPDIVTHIDGIETEGNSCMVHFEGFDAKEFLKNSLFILGTHTPDAVLKIVNKEHVYFFENYTFYYDKFGSLSGPCVGSTTTILALMLDFKEIYLLGLDLSLDPETGATHSGDHHYNKTHDLTQGDSIDTTISLRNNLIPIKGNFTKTVYSTPLFLLSVQTLFNNIPQLKDETQNVYNLNNGAFFDKTIPTHIQNVAVKDFKKIDKTLLLGNMYKTLQKHSQSGMNSEDLASIKKRLQNAQSVRSLIKKYEKKSFTNEDRYLYDLLGVVSDILKFSGREADNLTLVFGAYFQYTLPYIVDILNTKEVTKMMTHMKKIDRWFIEGCLNIVEKYINSIEDFLKNYR
ncbi:MAG: hypothetical protein QG565_1708 [Campylobacterota bacterium]|nr:hypothetical protein [Campylobacterota bacterium]